jgi:hypothetical protein
MIDSVFLIFWTLLIFLSIAWYGFLLFYVGFKGGREILELTRTLESQTPSADPPPERKV